MLLRMWAAIGHRKLFCATVFMLWSWSLGFSLWPLLPTVYTGGHTSLHGELQLNAAEVMGWPGGGGAYL